MQWFRMYGEFASDPKVQMLSEADQRRYVMLLCIRCNGDVTLQDEEVAFQLRISNDEWAKTKADLVSRGLIENDNSVSAWDQRQYVSDSSAARVRAHREKKKKAVKRECNVTVTPQTTDTDTDTERLSELRSDSSADTDPPDIPIPEDPKTSPTDTAELLVIPEFLKRTDFLPAAFEAWNEMAGEAGLPLVQNRSETRKKHLRLRLAECGGLEGWRAALEKVRASSFLTGAGERGWKADFDFAVTATKFTKIMEGGFDDGDRPQSEAMAALERMRAGA